MNALSALAENREAVAIERGYHFTHGELREWFEQVVPGVRHIHNGGYRTLVYARNDREVLGIALAIELFTGKRADLARQLPDSGPFRRYTITTPAQEGS